MKVDFSIYAIIYLKNFCLKGFSIKKIYILCAWCALFIILTLATIFGQSGEMGEMGRAFAMLNLSWFGYLGYVYLLFLLYPAYALYKDSTLSPKRVKIIIAVLLLSLGVLLVQSLWLDKGLLGALLIAKIMPNFGAFGVWILVIVCVYAGVLLLCPTAVITAQKSLQNAVLTLTRYLVRNIKEAFLYLAPRCVAYARYLYKAATAWLERVFASPSIKEFDYQGRAKNPIQLESSKINAEQMTMHRAHSTQESFDQMPSLESSLADMPNVTQLQNLSSSFSSPLQEAPREAPKFDEKKVVVLYRDEERERYIKEQEEERHRAMVRLIDPSQMNKDAEMLHIDVDQAISRAKAYEKEALLKDEATYRTKIIDLTQEKLESSTPQEMIEVDSPAIDRLSLDSSQMLESHSPNIGTSSAHDAHDDGDTHKDSKQVSHPQSQDHLADMQPLAQSSIQSPYAREFTQAQYPSPQDTLEQIKDSSPKIFAHKTQSTELSRRVQPTIVKDLESSKQHLESLERGELARPKDYVLPPTTLLQPAQSGKISFEEGEIDQKIQNLLTKLKVFKIDGDVARIYSGPVVTTFEFRPAPNVKVSRIQSLSDDLAMALSARSIRIQAPIPGKDVVGIEVPNSQKEMIYLREILESEVFQGSSSPLALGLGKDIVGNPFVTDLQKLPHLLIAGTTGSGKSVGLNAMILSLLYRNSPDNLRLIMVDPKKVEFSLYEEIPHLLTPIITDAKKAIIALNNVAREMERRYEMMKALKTKTIDGYNAKAASEGSEILPFIVIIIDELADLMMTGGKEAEGSIIRIAQMGRAAGLHLIVATQRPSVDVVTGLIKTNLPAKIAYKVGSRMDSRVILDSEGAQNLLGQGDMLFSLGGGGSVLRLHAPWASEDEIESIVGFIRDQREVQYDSSFLADSVGVATRSDETQGDSSDLLAEAKKLMMLDGKTSISNLQRRLGIGYNKAAVLVEELEKQGFLSAPNAKGVREIIG